MMKNKESSFCPNLLKSVIALWLAIIFILGGCGTSTPDETLLTETGRTTVTQETVLSEDEASTERTTQDQDKTTKSEKTTRTTKAPQTETTTRNSNLSNKKLSFSSIPGYSGKAYTAVNGNKPYFTPDEITTKAFEKYGSLDQKGRCTAAFACCGTEIMPGEDEKRGSISNIIPTGWVQAKYDSISGKYLYNRCHLIGWQLSAENANNRNLITGTKYLNIEGMLPFENMVADYIEETGNHVMYRVTPFFEGNNLLASGVQLEAYSVEDDGDGICFNVYCYNVQPGIKIDYSTGDSSSASGGSSTIKKTTGQGTTKAKNSTTNPKRTATTEAAGGFVNTGTYILNTNTKKIHYPGCSSVKRMKDKNKKSYSGGLDALLSSGYTKCEKCF